MKHSNIAFFIPHLGCPHQCTFCNQRAISGENRAVTLEEIRRVVTREVENKSENFKKNAEIAFFGGSFTAIGREKMMAYLEEAYSLVKEFGLFGIRLSTRPDAVEDEVLEILKQYGVTAIELGAQTTSDRVLTLNKRGHTAEDIFSASHRIRKYGFSLGLQIMPGLYGDNKETIMKTIEDVIEIHPDTIRVYPTVVVRNTELEGLYRNGEFIPLSVSDATEYLSQMIRLFEKEGIEIIKMGLHSEESLQSEVIAGPFHPALKELCESRMFYDIIKKEAEGFSSLEVFVNPKSISKAIGQGGENRNKFLENGIKITFKTDEKLGKYEIKIGRKSKSETEIS